MSNIRKLCGKGIRGVHGNRALDDELGYIVCRSLEGIEEASGGLYDLKEYNPVSLGRKERQQALQGLLWRFVGGKASGNIPYMHMQGRAL